MQRDRYEIPEFSLNPPASAPVTANQELGFPQFDQQDNQLMMNFLSTTHHNHPPPPPPLNSSNKGPTNIGLSTAANMEFPTRTCWNYDHRVFTY